QQFLGFTLTTGFMVTSLLMSNFTLFPVTESFGAIPFSAVNGCKPTSRLAVLAKVPVSLFTPFSRQLLQTSLSLRLTRQAFIAFMFAMLPVQALLATHVEIVTIILCVF